MLVADAGTPVISDPGYRLMRACIDRGLEIEVLPGPSAVTTALVASGLPADRWRFEGFLPRRAGELERILGSPETVVAFESPRRLPASLSALSALAPDRPAAVCRELTKLHEEVVRGTLAELARRFRDDVKGEIVVVIARGERGRGRGHRRGVRGRRPAPAGPVRGPPAGRRERRRGAHGHQGERPLSGADRQRSARMTGEAGDMRCRPSLRSRLPSPAAAATTRPASATRRSSTSLNLEEVDGQKDYAMDGDLFCSVERKLLNDSSEVDDALEEDEIGLVVPSREGNVGVVGVPVFASDCRDEARKKLSRLDPEDE